MHSNDVSRAERMRKIFVKPLTILTTIFEIIIRVIMSISFRIPPVNIILLGVFSDQKFWNNVDLYFKRSIL